MENINSGRSSPIRGRTMKEYEQQIGSLKKENFNLKLRIYFLEQNVAQKFKEEDIIKTNIELNVVCESLKKDVEEKKILLDKASSAIDSLTSQFHEKLEQEIHGKKLECEEMVQQANKKVDVLQEELKGYEDKLTEIENLKASLEDRDREIDRLSDSLTKTTKDFQEYRLDLSKEKRDLEERLESLSTNLTRKDRDVKRLSIIVEDKKLVDKGVCPLERSKLKDSLEDAQKEVEKLHRKISDKDVALLDKEEMIGNLEDLLREKEKALGEKGKELEEIRKEMDSKTRSYNKTKAHLITAMKEIQKKDGEVDLLKETVTKMEKELELTEEELKRDKERIADLEENLERLARSLGKKEGELESFKDMLRQAQLSLSEGEEAVQAIQRQFEQERQSWNEERKKYISMNGDRESTNGTLNPQQTFNISIHSSHLDGTTPQNSEVPSQEDGLHKRILELNIENQKLKNLLDATEQTAHTQTHKMKYYQRLLADNGLLPSALQRSNSEQNLARERNPSPKPLNRQNRFRSMERLGPKGRSVSLSPFRKGQVKTRSRSEKDDLHNGYQSPNTSLNGQDQDTTSIDGSFHALSRLFALIEKFLTHTEDRNLSDVLTPQSSSVEVSQLRTGLAQARCAMRSLLASESNFYGRESPDSGCSDNPASLPNNPKSPPSSPSISDSADNSPTSDRARSRTSKLDSQKDTQTSLVSRGTKLTESSQMSEIERNRGSNNTVYVWQDSMLKSANMSSVFESQTAVNTDVGNKNSVWFSEVNQSHSIPQYDDILDDYSPNEDADIDYSICKTLSKTQLSDLTGVPDHDRTMDNTMCKTLSKSRIADMSGIQDPEESLSTHLLDMTNTAKLESDNNLERLNRIINSYENDGRLDHNVIDKYMEELRQLRRQLENQLGIIQRLQEQLRMLDIESNRQLREKDQTIHCLNERIKEKDNTMKEQVESISQLKMELTKESENNQVALIETEKRYMSYINESKSQEKRLALELQKIEKELESTVSELNHDKMELQVCKDTIDEQTRLLFVKDGEIEQLRNEIHKRDDILKHQDQLCKDLEKRHETLATKNKEISSQMEEQKLNCADYRKQIEKQSLLIKELKERVDTLREELSQSINNRKSLEKAAVTLKGRSEADKTKIEKLKYNVNFMTTEYRKQKYKLQTAETMLKQKCTEIGDLKAALFTSQKLIDVQKLTDDEKHNYICMLLKELKELKEQLTNLIDQNDKITQHMIEIRERAKTEREEGIRHSQDGSLKDIDIHIETNITVGKEDATKSFQTSMSSAHNTWPGLGGANREVLGAETMSNSLPLLDRSHESISVPRSQQSSRSSVHSVDNLLTQSLPLDTDFIPKSSLGKGGSSEMGHFSIPGPIYKQQMTDECLVYNVNDSPRLLASMTRYKIDSDQRSLFAIGMIDHFEKLKKETHECQVILKGLSCRIAERLKKFTDGPASESIEYSTLKELSFSVDNLRICVDSQLSMIAGFWTSELPNPNEKGELINYKLLDEKAALEEELVKLKVKFEHFTKGKLTEEAVCDSLESTLQVVSQARKNLEQNRK